MQADSESPISVFRGRLSRGWGRVGKRGVKKFARAPPTKLWSRFGSVTRANGFRVTSPGLRGSRAWRLSPDLAAIPDGKSGLREGLRSPDGSCPGRYPQQ